MFLQISKKLKMRQTENETNCKYIILNFGAFFWVKKYLVLTYKVLVQKVA